MKRNIIIALALLLGFAQGAWAETYYIVEIANNTITFKAIDTAPNETNGQYSIDRTASNGYPVWSQGSGTMGYNVTTIIIDPSFAECRPTTTCAWFANKPSLTSLTGLQYLNTSEVTNMKMMFQSSGSLTELDLSGFNTAKVKNMESMFSSCGSLKTIVVGSGWTTSSVTSSSSMFTNCTALVGQNGTAYSHGNLNDHSYAHYGTDGYLTSEAYYWKGKVASSFSDTGTNTITIHNMGELKLFASNVNDGNTYSGYTIFLGRDIAFDSSVANDFTAIGTNDTYYFAGTFDGQGNTISGLNLSADGRQGIFGTIKGATIQKLTLDASTITSTSSSYAGGIVGRISDGGTITNCHVTNSVSVTAENSAGGIVGSIYLGTVSITGCTSAATVVQSGSSDNSAGGIAGFCGHEGSTDNLSATIADCLYHGSSVSGENAHIGAIVGGYVTNSSSTVSLSDNFYTYPNATVKGIGYKKESSEVTSTPFDIATGHGAICTRVITSDDDISDMGETKSDHSYSGGIAVYDNGVKYGDTNYSHILALPDGKDKTSLISQYDGQTFDVILRDRTLYKDGYWNTLSLPFSISNLSGSILATAATCEIKELDTERNYYLKDAFNKEDYTNPYKTGVKNGQLYLFFKKATSISAGTPYIVKWNSDANNYVSPTFSNVTINKTLSPVTSTNDGGKVTFQSTYAPFTRGYLDQSILFLGTTNNLYYPNGTGTTTVGPFRAYFQLNGVQMAGTSGSGSGEDYIPEGGGDARAFVLDIIIDDESSGIENGQWSNGQWSMVNGQSESWFTLDGRRLSGKPSRAGVYINNGVKVVMK